MEPDRFLEPEMACDLAADTIRAIAERCRCPVTAARLASVGDALHAPRHAPQLRLLTGRGESGRQDRPLLRVLPPPTRQ